MQHAIALGSARKKKRSFNLSNLWECQKPIQATKSKASPLFCNMMRQATFKPEENIIIECIGRKVGP